MPIFKTSKLHAFMGRMKHLFSLILCLALSFSAYQSVHAEEAEDTDKEGNVDINELIDDHVWDTHEYHIMDWNDHPVTLPLPVILWTDKGLVAFSSARFKHDTDGQVVVEAKGQKFINYEEHIFYADKFDKQKYDEASTLSRPVLYDIRPLDFSITKTVFTIFLSALIAIILFGATSRAYKRTKKRAPKGLAGFMEPAILFIRDEVARPIIGAGHEKYLPFLLTTFFFIWIANLVGMVPFFPFGGNVTGNIIVTMVLSLFVLVITLFNGKRHYWRELLAPDIPWLLYPIMVPIEIFGIFTKPFALMVRLFANMSAGHIIGLSLVSLIFIFGTVAISPVSIILTLFMDVLEILVTALQAYVFTILAALYFSQAAVPPEE